MLLITKRFITGCLLTGAAGLSLAGPVILGGDDLTDHGSRTVGGVNLEGWLYIQKAVDNILSGVTRLGTFTTDIVALGSAASSATSANAGAAIGSAANVLGKTVLYIDGSAAITQFFADLAAGSVNPKMLWFAGTGAANDLLADEGLALTANAAAINTFGGSGGGIMAHGSGSTAYGWLSALLPELVENVGSCNSTGATLTADGQAAFPGLSNSDINNLAGPCHSSFTGNFGGLTTLALDGNGLSYIIGGGAGTLIQCGLPGQPVCPTGELPEPSSMLLAALAGVALYAQQRRRRNDLAGRFNQ